jgi:putative heme transporter
MPTFRKPQPPPAPAPVVNVTVPPSQTADILRRPVIRTGLYAWALLGIVGALLVLLRAAGMVNIVVIPLILALFPAAVLAPLVGRLKNAGFPPALAALVTMLAVLGSLIGLGFALAPQVAGQFEGLGEQLRVGLDAVDRFLLGGPFGLDPIRMEDVFTRVREQLAAGGAGLGSGVVSAVTAVTEGLAGFVFGLVALFLYLKDGERMAMWLRNLFPPHLQADAAEVGVRAWQTVGAYVRGQLFIAVVDAVLIGIGLWIVGVPLALPLTVLVFFGGLFPIVGAVLAGAVAVLVALATNGLAMALIVLAIIIAVQQIEGNLLAPVVLGKATELHPLATLAALTAGAVLLGVLGAFLAIPVTASITRAASYLRQRRRERDSVLLVSA